MSTNLCILTGTNCTTSITTPQFIDTSHCLCALEPSRASADSTTELWRCRDNASDDATTGDDTGKWWYTVNANSNLEGFTEPLNSAGDPPDLAKAYGLTDDGNGGLVYAMYNGTGANEECTAKNDTQASAQYYRRREGASGSSNSTGSVSTSSALVSQSSKTLRPTPTATPLVSSSPTQTSISSANKVAIKTALLFGLCSSILASLFLP